LGSTNAPSRWEAAGFRGSPNTYIFLHIPQSLRFYSHLLLSHNISCFSLGKRQRVQAQHTESTAAVLKAACKGLGLQIIELQIHW